MPNRLLSFGSRLSGALLFITGCAKLVFASGEDSILQQPDPLLGLHYRALFLLVGTGEIVLGLFCQLRQFTPTAVWLVAIVATNFLIYNLGLLWIGFHGFCKCMGNLGAQFGLADETVTLLRNGILAVLLVVGYGGVWLSLRTARAAGLPRSTHSR